MEHLPRCGVLMTPDSIPRWYGVCWLVSTLNMWDVDSNIGKNLQHVGSRMGRFIDMARVGFEGARMIFISPL